jgi:hypothetical protein
MRAPDAMIGEIEARHAARIGVRAYDRATHHLQSTTALEAEE